MLRPVSLALLVALAALPAGAQEGPHTVGRIVATAGIAGRFLEGPCEGGTLLRAHDVSRFTAPLAALAEAHAPALVVDTGGLLTPHGVLRFAAAEHPTLVSELVVSLGYDALAVGLRDLSAPRERMVHVAEHLADAGVPYVLSNLACGDEAAALCAAVRDAADAPLLVPSGSVTVGVLAMLPPASLRHVAPDRAAGVTLAPLEDAVPASVRAARAAGADVVALVLDVRVDEALALATALPEEGRPDLVLLSGMGADLLFAEPTSRALSIVAPPPGGGVEVRVRHDDEDADLDWDMHVVPLAESAAPHAAVTRFAEALGPAYCETWGQPLPGGLLARDLPATEVVSLVTELVREHAGADVALLNAGVIDLEFFERAGERLTNGDLYVAIEFDEPIVVADVPASWLLEAQRRLDEHHVAAAGLTSTGHGPSELTEGNLRIRGRASVPRVRYRVATIRFLAEGGDDALPPLPDGITWTTLGTNDPTTGALHYDSLREIVLDALATDDARDPRDARVPPGEAPEWVLRGQIDGNFSGSSVSNEAAYEAAALASGSAIAMGLELDVHLDARAPMWSWESQFFGRYRTQWAPAMPGTEGSFTEAADQLQLRTLASYRGLRGPDGSVFIPDLYVEAFLESELTQPADRTYHWLLARPTVGLRFPLTSELDVKLQVGLQSQLLDPTAEAEFGAGASITLRPWVLVEGGGRSITVDGLVDFFDADLFDRNRWQLRGQLQTVLDLAGPLALTISTNLYLQADGDQAMASALSATIGLRLSGVTRTVGP